MIRDGLAGNFNRGWASFIFEDRDIDALRKLQVVVRHSFQRSHRQPWPGPLKWRQDSIMSLAKLGVPERPTASTRSDISPPPPKFFSTKAISLQVAFELTHSVEFLQTHPTTGLVKQQANLRHNVVGLEEMRA